MATTIDPQSAKSLMAEYRQQNESDGGPALKTDEGHFLKGFFIDRESLENMLADPDAVGVSISLAKHPDFVGSPENTFTLIYGAAEANPEPGGAPYVNRGQMVCAPPPCPPFCTVPPCD